MTVAGLLFGDADRPTFWSKLLRIADMIGLAVAPNVESATLVPITPTLDKSWLTLSSSDIWSIKSDARLYRRLRGVALVSHNPHPSGTNVLVSADNPSATQGICGHYDHFKAKNIAQNGLMAVRAVPPWLEPAMVGLIQPAAFATAVGHKQADTEQADLGPRIRHFGDRLAQWIYSVEALQNRQANVITRLRFDVCPGSIITLQGPDDDEKLPGYSPGGITGCVSAVAIDISANPPNASTTLQLSHVRTKDETDYTISAHPFYNTGWRGSPLLNLSGMNPPLVV